MLDHMILTVSNVERSLAFYEAAIRVAIRQSVCREFNGTREYLEEHGPIS